MQRVNGVDTYSSSVRLHAAGLALVWALIVSACSGSPGVAACAAPELAFSSGGDEEGDSRVLLARDSGVEVLTDEWVAGQPSFAPGDHEVVVVRAEGDYESAGPGTTELWAVPLDGSEVRAVTSGGFDSDPDWSRATDKIVFVRSNLNGFGEVRFVDGAGGAPTTVVTRAASLDSPRWSPNGDQIAYIETVLHDDGMSETSTVRIVGADGTPVLDPYEIPFASNLSWHPDGKSLLVSTYDRETGQILELNLDSGEQHEIASGVTTATWASNGEDLYFLTKKDAATSALWRVGRGHLNDRTLVLDSLIGEDSLYGYEYYGMATPHCAS